eukprot:gene9427-246_t
MSSSAESEDESSAASSQVSDCQPDLLPHDGENAGVPVALFALGKRRTRQPSEDGSSSGSGEESGDESSTDGGSSADGSGGGEDEEGSDEASDEGEE